MSTRIVPAGNRFARALAALILLLATGALAFAARAEAATPASGTITPDSGPITYQGQFYAFAANVSNQFGDQACAPSYPGGPNDPGAIPGVNQCDVFELTVNVPPGYWLSNSGGVAVDIAWEELNDDFDMFIFRKPPPGEPVGPPVASSTGVGGETTSEHAIITRAEGTYLVRVNPFDVQNSDYDGTVSFALRDPIPEVPGGIDQSRASSTGYLSYSEPHIAVDPLDPNHLVAGSKMYQNLEEYKFKIGTFVSFDGGRTWQDNGILPGYPSQVGNEGDDYHITSDVWMAFDDEGNAYTMVLDAPGEGIVEPAGWGMNLHKSTDGGETWSGPIPIERKNDPVTKELFLSDKNTLTVDNFGADGDGRTGNMYACWSEDAPVANLFVQVSRSTNAGQTWSEGTNVSGADRTVIGCFVLVGPPANPGQPGPLYVFWLDFSGNGRIRMAKSTDGGLTFSSPSTAADIEEIPGVFPNSAFRNLSIPWAAVDPRNGTVYLSWANYNRTQPGEPCLGEPGVQPEDVPPGQVCDADIMLVKSTDGGQTWSSRIRVNQDPAGNGRDQFQQAIAVTDSGQLNAMWFDRRNDAQNFYVDTFFARSNDPGENWIETRVTRSMWDPSINPPISPSGEFIGDYEGLAVNDCFGYPFWQDTTLANLPPSDPAHSPYQEAFSARIPNTSEFGGDPVPGVRCPEDGGGGKCVKVRNGTDTKDKIRGSDDSEFIRGLRGRDRLRAKGGDDCVRGNRGGDRIRAGKGDDEAKAGKGRDKVHGGPGKDELKGGAKRDRIKSKDGTRDVVRCGKGRDKVVADKRDKLRNCERVKR